MDVPWRSSRKEAKGKDPKRGQEEGTGRTDSPNRRFCLAFHQRLVHQRRAEGRRRRFQDLQPHSLRKFAENTMLACGLPEKFVGAIVGHAGKMGKAYQDELDNETTEKWFEVCNDCMTWLTQKIEVVKQDKKIDDLEAKLNLLLNAVAAKLAPTRGTRPPNS